MVADAFFMALPCPFAAGFFMAALGKKRVIVADVVMILLLNYSPGAIELFSLRMQLSV